MTLVTDNNDTGSRAAILRFPRKRGRPRSARPRRDTGTPELTMKRMKQETAETLDLCLERAIITPTQHWCGIHLRWLYTLRYGAPGTRAVDPTHLGGVEIKTDDPEWRSAREKEYNDAMQKLTEGKYRTLLMDVCIYNERPMFLKCHTSVSSAIRKRHERMVARMCDGLDLLAKHWKC